MSKKDLDIPIRNANSTSNKHKVTHRRRKLCFRCSHSSSLYQKILRPSPFWIRRSLAPPCHSCWYLVPWDRWFIFLQKMVVLLRLKKRWKISEHRYRWVSESSLQGNKAISAGGLRPFRSSAQQNIQFPLLSWSSSRRAYLFKDDTRDAVLFILLKFWCLAISIAVLLSDVFMEDVVMSNNKWKLSRSKKGFVLVSRGTDANPLE